MAGEHRNPPVLGARIARGKGPKGMKTHTRRKKMKKIVLVVLLSVCLIGMGCAQSNAAERALQGAWMQISTEYDRLLYTFVGNVLIRSSVDKERKPVIASFRVDGGRIIVVDKYPPFNASISIYTEEHPYIIESYTIKGDILTTNESGILGGTLTTTWRRVK